MSYLTKGLGAGGTVETLILRGLNATGVTVVIGCIETKDTYQPGLTTGEIYRGGIKRGESYQGGLVTGQSGCCHD